MFRPGLSRTVRSAEVFFLQEEEQTAAAADSPIPAP